MFNLFEIITRVVLGAASPQPAQPAKAVKPQPAQPARPTTPARQAPAAIVETVPVIAAPGGSGAVTAPPSTATSANDVVDKVQKFYADIKYVTALFRQSVTNQLMGTTKSNDGTVWLMKPGKMRWDYVEKSKGKTTVKKSFISNGTTLYVVEHGNKQVFEKSLQNDLMPVAVSFLYGKGDLKAEFNAELDTSGKFGAKGELVLKLTPKQPSAQYKNLFLVVSPDNFRVTQSVIVDSQNNVNHFRFYAPDFEKPVKESWFEFDKQSVKNYRIVNADEAAKKEGTGSAGAPAMPPKLPAVPPAPAPKQ